MTKNTLFIEQKKLMSLLIFNFNIEAALIFYLYMPLKLVTDSLSTTFYIKGAIFFLNTLQYLLQANYVHLSILKLTSNSNVYLIIFQCKLGWCMVRRCHLSEKNIHIDINIHIREIFSVFLSLIWLLYFSHRKTCQKGLHWFVIEHKDCKLAYWNYHHQFTRDWVEI